MRHYESKNASKNKRLSTFNYLGGIQINFAFPIRSFFSNKDPKNLFPSSAIFQIYILHSTHTHLRIFAKVTNPVTEISVLKFSFEVSGALFKERKRSFLHHNLTNYNRIYLYNNQNLMTDLRLFAFVASWCHCFILTLNLMEVPDF